LQAGREAANVRGVSFAPPGNAVINPHPPHLVFGNVPRTVYFRIETVNLCNNLCVICAYKDHERPKSFMPQAMFEKVVRDYAAIGGGYLSVTPLVGDVFMDRSLEQRFAFLRTIPEITGIGFTTNAAMVKRYDDEILGGLLADVTRMSISIYGVSESEYFEMTKRRTYSDMKTGLRRITTLSPLTDISLEFRLLEPKTPDELREWLSCEVFDRDENLMAKVKVNNVLTQYANWGIFDDKQALPRSASWLPFERKEVREQCLIPMFSYVVFSNGNLSFCSCDNYSDAAELRIGNVMDASLAELFSSEKARKLRDWSTNTTPEFCKGCSFHIPLSFADANPDILLDTRPITGAG
jgi:hypothetical protein